LEKKCDLLKLSQQTVTFALKVRKKRYFFKLRRFSD